MCGSCEEVSHYEDMKVIQKACKIMGRLVGYGVI